MKKIFEYFSRLIHGRAVEIAKETADPIEERRKLQAAAVLAKCERDTQTQNVSYLFTCIELLNNIKINHRNIAVDNAILDIEFGYYDELESQINSTIIQLTAKINEK